MMNTATVPNPSRSLRSIRSFATLASFLIFAAWGLLKIWMNTGAAGEMPGWAALLPSWWLDHGWLFFAVCIVLYFGPKFILLLGGFAASVALFVEWGLDGVLGYFLGGFGTSPGGNIHNAMDLFVIPQETHMERLAFRLFCYIGWAFGILALMALAGLIEDAKKEFAKLQSPSVPSGVHGDPTSIVPGLR